MADDAVISPAVIKAARLLRDNSRGMTNVYIARAARARWAVVASVGSRKTRIGAFSDDTLYELLGRQLAHQGDKIELGEYRHRRRGDSVYGYRINLTPNGRSL